MVTAEVLALTTSVETQVAARTPVIDDVEVGIGVIVVGARYRNRHPRQVILVRVPARTLVPVTVDREFELVDGLTRLLLRWSYEGTAGAERLVTRVAARYGLTAEVTFLADAVVLSAAGRTVVASAAPVVPPLHRVSALKRLL